VSEAPVPGERRAASLAPAELAAAFGDALRFLTIVPAPGERRAGHYGVPAFPLVGLAIGAGAVVLDLALGLFPFELRNVVLVGYLAIVSGGIHFDGLADTLDALGGGTPEERRRILGDAAIGAFGALGLMLGIALQLTSLSLLDETARTRALLTAPLLARWAMPLTGWRARTFRPEGLGAAFVAALDGRDLAIASGLAIAGAVLAGGSVGALAVLMAAAVANGVRRFADRRFDGVNGDILGAAGVIVETLTLALFVLESSP
jgi:adenosylcobinamide-GDP ribazoletransferase